MRRSWLKALLLLLCSCRRLKGAGSVEYERDNHCKHGDRKPGKKRRMSAVVIPQHACAKTCQKHRKTVHKVIDAEASAAPIGRSNVGDERCEYALGEPHVKSP